MEEGLSLCCRTATISAFCAKEGKALVRDHGPTGGTSISGEDHDILELNSTNRSSRLHRSGWLDCHL